MIENGSGDGTGLYRYEDILRAVGHYIDANGLQDVIVVQTSDGVRVHGYRNVSKSGGAAPKLIEHTFTADEIKRIDEESRQRRGQSSSLYG